MTSTNKQIPKVGMGATLGIGSDRYPYKIVRVSKSKKTFWMKPVEFKQVGDYYGTQKYEFSNVMSYLSDRRVHLDKKYNSWKTDGMFVSIGHMDAYQDPTF